MEPLTRTQDLIARVRAALRAEAEPTAPPAAGAPGPPEAVDPAEMLALFRGRFEATGGTFLEGLSPEATVPVLAETLRAAGVAALVVSREDEAATKLAEALAAAGPFRIATTEEARLPGSPPTAGIQTAEFAVAETGTIVQSSGGGKTLLPGLVTEVHVALLPAGILVPDMEEVLSKLSRDLPRNVSFITGPSRTADIELTITIGVHGPRAVIALLLP